MRRSALPRPARRAGFTLLEVTVAIMIFFIIIMFAYGATTDAYDQALESERMRQLRMLAERKLGEIAVFERFHDENLGPERFEDLPEEMRDLFEGWEWQLDVRDVTVFGTQKDENAPYLFESESGTDETKDEAGTGETAAAKKGETQVLRELVLKITAPSDDGEGDSLELVTYLPQVAARAVGAPAGQAPK